MKMDMHISMIQSDHSFWYLDLADPTNITGPFGRLGPLPTGTQNFVGRFVIQRTPDVLLELQLIIVFYISIYSKPIYYS